LKCNARWKILIQNFQSTTLGLFYPDNGQTVNREYFFLSIRYPDIFLSVNRIKSNVTNEFYTFLAACRSSNSMKFCLLSNLLLWKQKGHLMRVG